jgi:divalent metal cation (Fe/Co/Zn/Cd) transporter
MGTALTKHSDLALLLSFTTVGYNLLEGLVSVVLGTIADSPALFGFGVDSFVESSSGIVMIWRFSRAAVDERVEQTAIRLVGVSLVVLAAYVTYEATIALYYNEPPERSVVGLIVAGVSLFFMPVLYLLKRRTAKALKSRSLAADAKQTLACVMLSVALLVGTGLHYTIGMWQADPIAGLVIAAYLVREGYHAWTEREFCC